jgi:hypothetical protein
VEINDSVFYLVFYERIIQANEKFLAYESAKLELKEYKNLTLEQERSIIILESENAYQDSVITNYIAKTEFQDKSYLDLENMYQKQSAQLSTCTKLLKLSAGIIITGTTALIIFR